MTLDGIHSRKMKTNTKTKLYPTTVNLKELKPEGETFIYNQSTGELNKRLNDLVQNRDYDVEVQLLPMGNAFEISGKIRTSLDLLCSQCGRDMTSPVDEKFNELIVVMSERPRAGHSGHTGTLTEGSGPFCNYLSSYSLDLGDYIHELIAAAEPFAPQCLRADCENHLNNLKMSLSPQSQTSPNPFEILKNIQVKGQRG